MPSRRKFLKHASALAAGLVLERNAIAGPPAGDTDLIQDISRSIIFHGREQGPSWFHPRPALLPSDGKPRVSMTLQLISGSDVFGPVHWTLTDNGGATWTKPEPIPGLGRIPLEPGWERGVCDVVPEYHAASDTILAIGHDVFYKDGVLARPQRSRRPVYLSRSADGRWSEPRHLKWDHPETSGIYSCGCSQRVIRPDGDVLIPLTFGPLEPVNRSVTSVLCRYDGATLTVKKSGNVLKSDVKRGLLEPSLTTFDDTYYMTIRAEDGRGYVTTSDDGLNWNKQQPWCWDDGGPLTMSTTQQHWLPHSDGLFLVYTRETPENGKVIRYRAPLFIARVNPSHLCLVRESERVLLPIADEVQNPRHVALMGNFHTLNVSPTESWVTVGENRPYDGYQGDTLLARIAWSAPNDRVNLE